MIIKHIHTPICLVCTENEGLPHNQRDIHSRGITLRFVGVYNAHDNLDEWYYALFFLEGAYTAYTYMNKNDYGYRYS